MAETEGVAHLVSLEKFKRMMKWLVRLSLGIVPAAIALYRQQDNDYTHGNLGNSVAVVVFGSLVAMILVIVFQRATGQDQD